METIIKVENVSKKFKLYYDRPLSLKERVIRGSKGVYKEFYALQDVSFDIKKGSTVGLLGQNGCGKSTLLKIINRTMFPEEGKVTVKGRVASLIELGAGFHPELSGRENIYTNATIFGFTKEEIDERIPEIIKFSELEDFIDNPIRTYSSGMYARLGFSVAIHVDADILLVDEILGVGDMNFQAKCANKIYEMRKKGVTIVMVSHDMSSIDRLCDYAIWLDHGVKKAEGEPKEIENLYMKFMSEKQEERLQTENEEQNAASNEIEVEKQENVIEQVPAEDKKDRIKITHLGDHFGNGDLIFTDCKMLNDRGTDKRSFQTGEKMILQAKYVCQVPPEQLLPNIGFEISTAQGTYIYGTNTSREGNRNISLKEKGKIEVIFDQIALLPGEYTIGVAVADTEEKGSYDHYHNIAQFKVYSNIHDVGLVRIEHKFVVDEQVIKTDLSGGNNE